MARLVEMNPSETEARVASGEAILVDVREPFEHASERIAGATPHALSSFDADAVRTLAGGRAVIFQCRSGKRSADAARRYAVGGDNALHLAGGIEAWKASGLPTERSARAPRIDVMRQVQITAGLLIITGVALGAWAHPGFLGIAAFVGVGLTIAGVTGWCGMAKLLARTPWNRVR